MTDTQQALKQRTIVRRAAAGDVYGMVLVGRDFFNASGYAQRGVEADPHILHASLAAFLDDDTKGMFVAEADGQIVGVAAVTSFHMFFSPTKIAMELFWWVNPGSRGGSMAALRLLDELEAWSRQAQCHLLCMVDLPGIESPAPKIYARRGFTLGERTWIKELA